LVGPGCAGQITLHDLSIVQADSGEHFAGRKEHRELVGIPGEVMFASKPQLAGVLIERAARRCGHPSAMGDTRRLGRAARVAMSSHSSYWLLTAWAVTLRGSTRDRIVTAATAEFSRYGIAGARTDRIARAAKTSKERVYAYFSSKEPLYRFVSAQELAAVAEATRMDPTDLPGYAGRVHDYFTRHLERFRLMTWGQLELGTGDSLPDDAIQESAGRKIEQLRKAQKAGLLDPPGTPRHPRLRQPDRHVLGRPAQSCARRRRGARLLHGSPPGGHRRSRSAPVSLCRGLRPKRGSLTFLRGREQDTITSRHDVTDVGHETNTISICTPGELSTALIRENQAIAVEDLAVKALARTRMARSVHDAGWSAFVYMLEYKARRYGRGFRRIGRFEPTSQVCSACGARDGPKPLHIRTWQCGECGAWLDRDVNAAVNVARAAGLAVTACGAQVRPGFALAQRGEAGTHRGAA
jgi:IS605 OrfB family transposase